MGLGSQEKCHGYTREIALLTVEAALPRADAPLQKLTQDCHGFLQASAGSGSVSVASAAGGYEGSLEACLSGTIRCHERRL